MIVYPAIDLRHGRCVRLVQGDPRAETVFSDDPAATAQRWAEQGAEWLHVVNLDGAFGDATASANLAALRAILEAVSISVQLGGGLRTLPDIEAALALGVERAIIGTAALEKPTLVQEAVRRFGAGAIAVAIDARDGRVATRGWQTLSEVAALDLAQQVRDAGVERVIYTDISRDGMLSGVNAAACAQMAQATGLRVIASGGVATLVDVERVRAVEAAGVEGVIIGRALYTGQIDLRAALSQGRAQWGSLDTCHSERSEESQIGG